MSASPLPPVAEFPYRVVCHACGDDLMLLRRTPSTEESFGSGIAASLDGTPLDASIGTKCPACERYILPLRVDIRERVE